MMSLYNQVLENFQVVVMYWPPFDGESLKTMEYML